MRPGPSTRMSLGCFGSDAGAGWTRLAVTDMQCFQRHSARRRRQSSAPSLMTANVHTEAKVPCIAQSESFGPSRGARRPRPADVHRGQQLLRSRQIRQASATMRLASPAMAYARAFAIRSARATLPATAEARSEMRNPREHTRAKNVLSLWNPRRRRKRRCWLAFRLFRRGGSFTSR